MPKIEKQETLEVSREDSINLLLASIGFEELGLSHILNAEGEKLQSVIRNYCRSGRGIRDILKINNSVNDILKTIATKEIILNYKLENVIELMKLDLFSNRCEQANSANSSVTSNNSNSSTNSYEEK